MRPAVLRIYVVARVSPDPQPWDKAQGFVVAAWNPVDALVRVQASGMTGDEGDTFWDPTNPRIRVTCIGTSNRNVGNVAVAGGIILRDYHHG